MRNLEASLIAAVAMMIAIAAPVGAITYGELDAGEHPYVGFMIFFDPNVPGWFRCSGTLLDADTFLTAGHCASGIGTNGAVGASTSGGNDVWVTFDDTDALAGFPRSADYPTEAALYAARSAWLNDPANGYTRGTAYPHPEYDDFAAFPVTFDAGVVELSAGRSGPYGALAPLGTAEILLASAKNRNDALVETVGYGRQSIQPRPLDVETRYKSTSRIVELNGNAAMGGNLHTLNNPSAIGGRGGSCFGDSGGPVFVNNTSMVVAVVSWGNSGTCHGADYSWRVDNQDSYDFIGSFLGS